MAETRTITKENGGVTITPAQRSAKSTSQKRGPSVSQIYALPAPIRTFPLPAFYPNNVVSLLTVAYAWLCTTLFPPHKEPAVIHRGVWSEATGSVHVTDEKSIRALWEQGFYGKGSLSRSEPNWLKRELVRRGRQDMHVNEILTSQRREERAQAKWERARLEQEAIRQTRLKEAEIAALDSESHLATVIPSLSPSVANAPVGPLELLSLPNSQANINANMLAEGRNGTQENIRATAQVVAEPVPIDNLSPITTKSVSEAATVASTATDGYSSIVEAAEHVVISEDSVSCDDGEDKALRQSKSVRFSTKVKSTTSSLADPPSLDCLVNSRPEEQLSNENSNETVLADTIDPPVVQSDGSDTSNEEIVNMEHLQLTPEESYFLTFGLGALSITDPRCGAELTNKELFTLFRQFSYFPPRNGPDESGLAPDDGFLLNYAVYHHFRSLGWVPRAGIKFGVDWLLYTRGPVFDHAEFGLIIIPSYSDPWWKARGKQGPSKPWHWLHSIVRVLSHVMKSLVLVYVDVPPPPKFDAAVEKSYAEVLKLYHVREVMVKRWSSNRNR